MGGVRDGGGERGHTYIKQIVDTPAHVPLVRERVLGLRLRAHATVFLMIRYDILRP